MTNNDQTKPKSEYIRLRDGLAIRKVPQSKNWNLYLNLPGHKRLQFSLKTPDEDKAIELAWVEYTFAKAMLHNGEPLRQPTQRLTLVQVLDEIIKEHEKAQSKRQRRSSRHAYQDLETVCRVLRSKAQTLTTRCITGQGIFEKC